jgi:hypothetical protein
MLGGFRIQTQALEFEVAFFMVADAAHASEILGNLAAHCCFPLCGE